MSKRFYITTAIDYVNGQPHLGHAYEKVVADVIARTRRSMGENSFYLTGLDEHGQKVQQVALESGKSPQLYCDELAVHWKELTVRLNLNISDFVRTSEPRHKAVVQAVLARLHQEGQFYKAEYRGFYSARQETFLTEKDRRPDGTFDPFYGEVVELSEENWYFKLSPHQDWLIQHIEANPDFIRPDYRRNEVLGFLRTNTLEDLCLTRPAARLNWGIPLPFAPDWVTYVWFDALLNYFSVPAAQLDPVAQSPIRSQLHLPAGAVPPDSQPLELWPPDVQVIGKDILKFHAVYWPIMLKAIGVPLPKQILAHGWWQKDGQRMSKSTGNVVDPIAVVNEWGADAFRYYVIREMGVGPDGNWTDLSFQSRYNAELANGLGNLVNRSLSMLRKYRQGIIPTRSDELSADVTAAVQETTQLLRDNELQAALVSIWKIVNRANLYVDQTAPFKLAKDPSQARRLDEILYNLVETSRILAIVLWPYIPVTAAKIYQQLGLSGSPERWSEAAWGGLVAGQPVGEPAPLFPRKDLPPSA